MEPAHVRALAALHRRGRLRTLAGRQGLDFSSNDYLGLAQSAALREIALRALERGVPLGSGGSRLLRGNHEEHERLEREAAAFFGAESALYFATGYGANSALMSTLPRRGDLVVHDEHVHASMREGLRLSAATVAVAPHGDVDAMDAAIVRWRRAGGPGRPWLVAETLYSMEGDRAPVASLLEIAERREAMLVLDEAHATGVYGTRGQGLAPAHACGPNVVTLHTCGKALGVMGALLCLPRSMRDYMINRARGFIYATAPSPLLAATVRGALKRVADGADLRTRLSALVEHAGRAFQAIGLPFTGSPIQPLILGADQRANAAARMLGEAGFDVRAIRSPTVPPGTARLRIALTLNVSPADVDALAGVLDDVVREAA
jgi:8-amino-7-oxononanoate synthase